MRKISEVVAVAIYPQSDMILEGEGPSVEEEEKTLRRADFVLSIYVNGYEISSVYYVNVWFHLYLGFDVCMKLFVCLFALGYTVIYKRPPDPATVSSGAATGLPTSPTAVSSA